MVEILVCWEDFEVVCVILKNSSIGEEMIKFLWFEEIEGNENDYVRDVDGNDLEIVEFVLLLEWLVNEYKKFGCVLEFILDKL